MHVLFVWWDVIHLNCFHSNSVALIFLLIWFSVFPSSQRVQHVFHLCSFVVVNFATFFSLFLVVVSVAVLPFHPLHRHIRFFLERVYGRFWVYWCWIICRLTVYLYATPHGCCCYWYYCVMFCFYCICSFMLDASSHNFGHISHLVGVSVRVFWFVGLCVLSLFCCVGLPRFDHTFSHTQSVNIHIHKWFKQ